MNNGGNGQSIQSRMQAMLIQKDYKGLAAQCVSMGFTVEALQMDKSKASKFQEVFKDHAKPIFQEMLVLHQAALFTANQMKQLNQYKQAMASGANSDQANANLLLQQQKAAAAAAAAMRSSPRPAPPQTNPGIGARNSPLLGAQTAATRNQKPAGNASSISSADAISGGIKPAAGSAAASNAQTPKERLSAQFLYLAEHLKRILSGDMSRERGFQFISCFLRIVSATKTFQYQPTEKERLVWSQAQQTYSNEAFLPIRKEFEVVFKQQQQQKEAASQQALRAQAAQQAAQAQNQRSPTGAAVSNSALPGQLAVAASASAPSAKVAAMKTSFGRPSGSVPSANARMAAVGSGSASSAVKSPVVTQSGQFVVPQHASFNPAPQLSSKVFSVPTHGGSQTALGGNTPTALPSTVGIAASAASASAQAAGKRKREIDRESLEKMQMFKEEPFLLRSRLEELLQQMDPHEKFEPETLELLLEVADDFIEQIITFGCKLARHRGSNKLCVKDMQVLLERNYNIRVPGYNADLSKAVKRNYSLLYPTSTAKHRDNVSLVKSTIQQDIEDEAALNLENSV